jgi:drug/metabolite transporter (DMT)-like permease
MNRTQTLAWAAFAIVCVVWGTTYLAIRIALETIPPLLLTATRFIIAGAIMFVVAEARGQKMPRDRKTLLDLTLVGFLMVGVGNLAVVWAEQWVPSGLAALLVATAPFWMAIIEMFRRGGERLDVRSTIGMTLGFGGVALLVTPKGAGGAWNMGFVLGALGIQIGSLCWQLGSAHGKYRLAHVPLLQLAALQMLFGGIIVGVVALAIGEGPRFHVNARTLGALVYLTLFGSVLAYSAYIFAVAHMRTTHASLYAYVNPVVAMLLGWLILAEPLTWLSFLAMIIILAGVALVKSSEWRGRRKMTIAGGIATPKSREAA